MKYSRLTTLILATASCVIFQTCKKDKKEPEPALESGQESTDSRSAQSENDIALGDINTVIMEDANLRGRVSGGVASSSTICGLTIDTTGRSTGSITLNFDGTACNNRARTGQIKLAIVNYTQGKRWRDQGCVLQLQYIAYKITRPSDQKSVELNGTQLVTNESGGTWWEFLILKSQPTLVHTVTGTDLKVKFDSGKEATYNIHRRVTYSFMNNIPTCTAQGIGSAENLNNLENYGQTRNGAFFTSQVTSPVVWNLTCGAGAPVKGEVNIQVSGKGALLCTFGTDQSGNPINVGSNQCAYGWKLRWTSNDQTRQRVIAYR